MSWLWINAEHNKALLSVFYYANVLCRGVRHIVLNTLMIYGTFLELLRRLTFQ